ncbi:MAG: iron ABC transporter permease [Deltaproteobacteria bacterium]|nr:iron ABC transporter permease [Deltaproteobacteria bacterium]
MARSEKILGLLCLLLAAAALLALPAGRYPAPPGDLARALADYAAGRPLSGAQEQLLFLLFHLRLPRMGAALLVGAALAVSGTVYQNMFQNPLVSPGILGVQSGAAFGAAVGIVVFSSWPLTQGLSFLGGAAGVGLSLFFAWLYPKARFLALIVGGLVSGSFFMALTSLMQYAADPQRQLPELVYWLMGTLSRAEPRQLLWTAPLMLAGILYLCLQGKAVNALSMGDDEARALGVESGRMKLRLISAATLVCSLTVVLAGVINWVGLVIPHVMRFIVGPDNRVGLPASALGGALFVLLTDTLVRSVWTVELPLGVATSLISMPLFAFSLWYDWRRR